jgi:hypothetical protein
MNNRYYRYVEIFKLFLTPVAPSFPAIAMKEAVIIIAAFEQGAVFAAGVPVEKRALLDALSLGIKEFFKPISNAIVL